MSPNDTMVFANDDLKSLGQKSHEKKGSIEDKAMALL
jgi:hypothetical protein